MHLCSSLLQAKFSTSVSQSASSSKKSKIQIVAFNDPKAFAPRLQSFKVCFVVIVFDEVALVWCVWYSHGLDSCFSQVIFEDLEAAQQAMEEFQEDASLVDNSSAFAKAFTADFYVNTEAEVIALAAESWQQFKAKARIIVVVCSNHVIRSIDRCQPPC